VLEYASPRPRQRWPLTAGFANAGGQLGVLALGVIVGEGLLGLPAHEDGWGLDLFAALFFGIPAAAYGVLIFFVYAKWNGLRNTTGALIAGCLNGLLLTGIVTGSNAVPDSLDADNMALFGLIMMLVGPVMAATLVPPDRTQTPRPL